MPTPLLSIGLTWGPLISNQVYALPARACYITVQGTAPTQSVDGTTFAALPASGVAAGTFLKSAAADTIVTLKPI